MTTLNDHQREVLLHAHNHRENQTFTGDTMDSGKKVRGDALMVLGEAGLLDVVSVADAREPAYINWGRDRSYRDRVIKGGLRGKVTEKGRALAESLGGTRKHECGHPECDDVIDASRSLCEYHQRMARIGSTDPC